jgi:hypothetical protein
MAQPTKLKAKLAIALSVLALISSLQAARAEKSHGAPHSPERVGYCFAKLVECKDSNNRRLPLGLGQN